MEVYKEERDGLVGHWMKHPGLLTLTMEDAVRTAEIIKPSTDYYGSTQEENRREWRTNP